MRTKLLYQDTSVDVVTLEEAMEHSRITDDFDEIVVQGCLDAAHDAVQQWLNRKIYPSTVAGQVNEYRERISLPYPPIHKITSVSAEDRNGNTVSLTAGVDYKFDTISESIRFIGNKAYISSLTDIEFEYTCGYQSIECVPRAVRHAILMTFATLYENREDIIVGASVNKVPLSAQRLVRTHRVRGHT